MTVNSECQTTLLTVNVFYSHLILALSPVFAEHLCV